MAGVDGNRRAENIDRVREVRDVLHRRRPAPPPLPEPDSVSEVVRLPADDDVDVGGAVDAWADRADLS